MRRPGDRVVRRSVLERETYDLKPPRPKRKPRNPAVVLASGFAILILAGTILLSLPFANAGDESVPVVTALFTATSAVCVTGLVVVDTQDYWSTFGEIVILALIQLGGFGFMTSSTMFFLIVGRRATLRDRLALEHAMGGGGPGEAMQLVRRVGIMTLVIEAAGILLLLPRFLLNDDMPVGQAIWWSVFHSISAFNNAGFDLFGDFRSLIGFQQDPWLLLVIGMLVLLGGLSYVVLADLWLQHRWRRLLVDTKLVLATTSALLFVGTVLFLMMEWNNPNTLGTLTWPYRLLNAVFLSITVRTAGFTQLALDQLQDHTLFLAMPLMFIGTSAGSTGGGIKVQTFSLLFFAILAALRSREHVVAFGREVPQAQVYRALAIALLAIAWIIVVALVVTLMEPVSFIAILFESISAFGTVGLSTGITPGLETASQLVIILAMYVGRIGPLTLALALAQRVNRTTLRYARESVRIG